MTRQANEWLTARSGGRRIGKAKAPMATPRVSINPKLIAWARETAGFTEAELADKVGVERSVLQQWESGHSRPRLTQLEGIADHCRRPLAAFLLREPPDEPESPPDFRSPPGRKPAPLSPRTRFAIRRARWLRSSLLELYRGVGLRTKAEFPEVRLEEDLQAAALAVREWLDVPPGEQAAWRNEGEALKQWRAALHGRNVLVLQMPMDEEEMRAFSLAFDELPVIVVNISEKGIRGRIFSIFHELAHVMRRTGGMCLGERSLLQERPAPEERLSDRFANEALVLADSVSVDELVPPFDDLTRRLKVSKYVLLYRARDLGAIGDREFRGLMGRWRAEAREAAKGGRRAQDARRRGGGPSGAQRALWELGPDLASLVIAAESDGVVTAGEAAEYLDVKADQLEKVADLLAGV